MFISIIMLQIVSLVLNALILYVLFSPVDEVDRGQGMMTPNGFIKKKIKRAPIYNTDEKQYASEIGQEF